MHFLKEISSQPLMRHNLSRHVRLAILTFACVGVAEFAQAQEAPTMPSVTVYAPAPSPGYSSGSFIGRWDSGIYDYSWEFSPSGYGETPPTPSDEDTCAALRPEWQRLDCGSVPAITNPNGCGSGWQAPFIPDEPEPGVSFTQACNGHDSCFVSYGVAREQCDSAFSYELGQACRVPSAQNMFREQGIDEGYWGEGLTAYVNNRTYECDGSANIYAGAVMREGLPFYQSSQLQAVCSNLRQVSNARGCGL